MFHQHLTIRESDILFIHTSAEAEKVAGCLTVILTRLRSTPTGVRVSMPLLLGYIVYS